MSHHFDGIEGAHRRIGGCTASLFHFYDRLLFTPDSYSSPALIYDWLSSAVISSLLPTLIFRQLLSPSSTPSLVLVTYPNPLSFNLGVSVYYADFSRYIT